MGDPQSILNKITRRWTQCATAHESPQTLGKQIMPELLNNLILKRCPHCSVDTPFLHSIWRTQTQDFQAQGRRFWSIYVCARCGGLVTASSDDQTGKINEMYPSGENVINEAIPERVQTYLNQASDSLNAPSGSVMLSASAVDAILKDKEYKEGSLYTRIDKAISDGLITKDMGIWAHEIRLDANEQRHADEEFELPVEKDARRCLEFANTLATLIYVLPSMVKRGIKEAKTRPNQSE